MSKFISLGIGVFLMFFSSLIPTPLGPATQQILGIFIGALWLWITYSIEVGSIGALAALCLMPNVTTGAVISSSFGNTTIWFLVFSMVLTYALSSSGVLRRVAIYFIDNPVAKKHPYWFMGCYFAAIMVLGSFMAPTVSFILFFGLVKEIYELLGLKPKDKLARNLMIGTGFFASISCAFTPIAHTFPLMALGYYETATGEAISYAQYMKISIPAGILIAIVAYVLLIARIDKNSNVSAVTFENSKWTKNEIISVIVFAAVVVCWMIVGIWPKTFAALNALGTVWPAMIGVIILAACGILNVKEAFTKGVSWPAILLCATTLALGKYITADEYGIISYIGTALGKVHSSVILFVIVVVTIILTNLISNIVTTTVSFNLFVPAILAAGAPEKMAILATILIGFCASLAYALPSSIAHIALAGSSGWATAKDMAKYGFVLMLISILIVGVFVL